MSGINDNTDTAHIAWLAIWNRELDRLSEDDHEEKSHEDSNSGVIYTYIAPHEDPNAEIVGTRRVGLAQGLVDFTRSFTSSSAEGPSEIRVVHSQNQRLVFLQPEIGYWIACAYESRPSTKPAHSHFLATSSASSVGSPPPKSTSARSKTILKSSQDNKVVIDNLQNTYDNFRLFNGSFCHILEKNGIKGLQESSRAYFDRWTQEPVTILPLGIVRSPFAESASLPPVTDSLALACSLLSSSILLVHRSGLLKYPPASSSLTLSDTSALSTHLLTLFPVLPLQSLDNIQPSLRKNKFRSEQARQVSKDKTSSLTWKRTLSLGGLGGYLGMAGSSANIPDQKEEKKTDKDLTKVEDTLKQQLQHATTGWMPKLSMFTGGTHKTHNASGGSSSPGSPRKEQADFAGSEGPAINYRAADKNADSDSTSPDLEVQERETASVQDTLVGKNAEHAPHALQPTSTDVSVLADYSEAIQDAISGDLQTDTGPVGSVGKVLTSEALKGKSTMHSEVEVSRPERVFVGEDGEWKEMTVLLCNKTDDLAMAILSPPTSSKKDSDTKALQEAAISYLLILSAALIGVLAACEDGDPALSSQLYSVQNTSPVETTTYVNTALPSSSTASTRTVCASNAFSDVGPFASQRLHELYIRTYTSQWIVARFHPRNRLAGAHGIKDVTVLPKTIGKEGSLVDADSTYLASVPWIFIDAFYTDEIRRLEILPA